MLRNTLYITVLLFALVFGACTDKKVEAPKDWKLYKNYNYDMQMYYPPNWALANNLQDQLIFNLASAKNGKEDMVQENVNMVRTPIPDNVKSLEDFLPIANKLILDHYIDPKLLKEEKIDFAGQDAYYQKYSAVVNETPLIWEQTFFFKNGDVVVWTFAAESARFDQYKDTADIISGTIIFK